uniref:Seroin transcript 1B n=1 Tax=Spodoptera frugiperda TaxID=7108 RepID=A0A455LAN1_SPOFR|nr:seroin transcript 1B [Spodoptera frugiperda]
MLTAFLVVMTSAGWPGWPTGDNPFAGYHSPMLSALRFGPISMPNPGFPKFPTIPSPTFLFPFPTMPTFQSIQDMVKTMPNKGSYSGVVVSTQTESKMKDDGTLVKKGGSTIVINDDGKVTVHTSKFLLLN